MELSFTVQLVHRLATLRTHSPALVPALFEFSLRLWILRFLNGQSGTWSQFHFYYRGGGDQPLSNQIFAGIVKNDRSKKRKLKHCQKNPLL